MAKITDYPKVTELTRTNVLLLDGEKWNERDPGWRLGESFAQSYDNKRDNEQC